MFQWLKRKSTPINLILRQISNYATWTQPDYSSLSQEGYIKNVVAHHCITRISQAVANIPTLLSVNGKEIEDDKHFLNKCLDRPNPRESYEVFMRTVVMHKLISGNSYILTTEAMLRGGRDGKVELSALRPDRVTIVANTFSIPEKYIYSINGKVYEYKIDPITYESEILHLKEPNPLDDLYGLSPIRAAAMAVDQHNEAGQWNKALLENSAKPSGLLAFKGTKETPSLDENQVTQLRELIDKRIAGRSNAGKVNAIPFGMEWVQMGMSPIDMDWINGKNTSARDICLAFGYPAYLLGMAEGATFTNVAEAKLSLYEETVIPLTQSILAEISHQLTRKLKMDIDIKPDLDQVSALMPRREVARKNARDDVREGIISINEAREESGYKPKPNADDLLVPVNKLPLDFDAEGLNARTEKDPEEVSKSIYIDYLVKQAGYSKEAAELLANKAYEDG